MVLFNIYMDFLCIFLQEIYEKIKEEGEKEIVDRITLVCMGHEPDLAGAFKEMVGKYNIDVELVDILLDKSNLEFMKRKEKNNIDYLEYISEDSFDILNALTNSDISYLLLPL